MPSNMLLEKPCFDSGGAPTTPAAVTHLSPARAGHYQLFGRGTPLPHHEAQTTLPETPMPGGDGVTTDEVTGLDDSKNMGEAMQPTADTGAANVANGGELP